MGRFLEKVVFSITTNRSSKIGVGLLFHLGVAIVLVGYLQNMEVLTRVFGLVRIGV